MVNSRLVKETEQNTLRIPYQMKTSMKNMQCKDFFRYVKAEKNSSPTKQYYKNLLNKIFRKNQKDSEQKLGPTEKDKVHQKR